MILKYNVDIPPENRTRKHRVKYSKDIMTFLKSGHKNCEMQVPRESCFAGVVLNYRTSVKRLGLSEDITVVQRDGRVFLARKEKAS